MHGHPALHGELQRKRSRGMPLPRHRKAMYGGNLQRRHGKTGVDLQRSGCLHSGDVERVSFEPVRRHRPVRGRLQRNGAVRGRTILRAGDEHLPDAEDQRYHLCSGARVCDQNMCRRRLLRNYLWRTMRGLQRARQRGDLYRGHIGGSTGQPTRLCGYARRLPRNLPGGVTDSVHLSWCNRSMRAAELHQRKPYDGLGL